MGLRKIGLWFHTPLRSSPLGLARPDNLTALNGDSASCSADRNSLRGPQPRLPAQVSSMRNREAAALLSPASEELVSHDVPDQLFLQEPAVQAARPGFALEGHMGFLPP